MYDVGKRAEDSGSRLARTVIINNFFSRSQNKVQSNT